MRAGLLLVDTAPYVEMRQRLELLTAPQRTFRHSARELLAFASWKGGDMAAMRKWLKLIRDDQETPAALRQRVEVLTALAGEAGKG